MSQAGGLGERLTVAGLAQDLSPCFAVYVVADLCELIVGFVQIDLSHHPPAEGVALRFPNPGPHAFRERT